MKQQRHIQNPQRAGIVRAAAVCAALLCVLLCLSSCSKKKVSNFYGAKDDVYQELLVAFEEKDYELVLTKIERYRTHSGVDKDQLSALERIVNENLAVQKANKYLETGDFDKALSELEPFAEVDPIMKDSVQKLRIYITGGEKLNAVRNMTYSGDIIMAAMDLSAFLKARTGMFPKSFLDFCESSIEDAQALSVTERTIADELLFRDACDAIENKQPAQAAAIFTYFSMQDVDGAQSKTNTLINQGLFDR